MTTTVIADFRNELRNEFEAVLENYEVEFPQIEAHELLVCADSPDEAYDFLHRRTENHEPTAYIVGHSEFAGHNFRTDARALIPRSETETLLEAAQEIPKEARVVDVGTGCGALAISLKISRPDLDVTGIDISKDALDLACVNMESHRVHVDLRHGDLLQGARKEFDAVLANLPYLPTSKAHRYAPEMTLHEPQVSLWGGDDGLDLIRELMRQVEARRKIRFVALECGRDEHEPVMEIVRKSAFRTVYGVTDDREDIRAIVGKR